MRKSIIACLIIASFAFAAPASAASLGISLSPSLLTVNLKPGRSITQSYEVRNLSSETSSFVARVVPFVPGELDDTPVLKPNQEPSWLGYFSLSNSDIKLDEPFLLKSHESKQLILTIDVPRSAASSDIYASLLVSTVLTGGSGSGSNLGATIGSNILLTVNPLSHPPAIVKIEKLSPTQSSFIFRYGDLYIADSLSRITIEAVAKNYGKFLTQTEGKFTVIHNNQTAYEQTVAPKNLLSNSQRSLSASPSGELTYKPSLTHLGLYIFTIDLKTDNSNSHDEVTVLILPIYAILAGLVLATIGLVIIKAIRRK